MVAATLNSKKYVVDAFQGIKYKTSKEVEKEGDVSTTLHQTTLSDPNRQKFEAAISRWVNEHTASEHLVVRDFMADLATGEIIIFLLSALTGKAIEYKELARSAVTRQENLGSIIRFLEDYFPVRHDVYNPKSINSMNHAAIYSLMYDIAHHLECPYDLPSDFTVRMIRREMIRGGNVIQKTESHVITGDESETHKLNIERRTANNIPAHMIRQTEEDDLDQLLSDTDETQDAFDSLFSAEIEKVDKVCMLMLQFVDTHVGVLTTGPVEDLTEGMHDGVRFLWLLGSLGQFFVPLTEYVLKPDTAEEKLRNVKYCLRLMDHMGVSRKGIRSQKVVDKDSKTIFRMTYSIFSYSRRK